MTIYELRNQIGTEIVDYSQLTNLLKNYAHPRGKISKWLNTKELLRIKKGLYIFGDEVRHGPYSLEMLANLIYGPSAISLNYALSYYGLIPERVHTITSITSSRYKEFDTDIGKFTYRYMRPGRYAIGIQRLSPEPHMSFLIATPEKALCDLLFFTLKDHDFKSLEDARQLLIFDLRVDLDSLKKLDMSLIETISVEYHNTKLTRFIKLLKKMVV